MGRREKGRGCWDTGREEGWEEERWEGGGVGGGATKHSQGVCMCVPKSSVARSFSTLRLCCMSCVGW